MCAEDYLRWSEFHHKLVRVIKTNWYVIIPHEVLLEISLLARREERGVYCAVVAAGLDRW